MCVCVMKTAMTNFDIAAILPELRQQTIGGRIHNVYQITPEAFLLKIHPNNLHLVVEPRKRIHLTRFEVKTPAKPSQLCMALRKHIRGAKIFNITQPDFERLVIIETEGQGKRQKIIVELLPRGTIIIADEHDRVVVSSHYARMKDRNILRGQPLRLPPPRGKNILEISFGDIKDLRRIVEADAVKALAQAFGVSGIYAEEILQRAKVPKLTPARDLSDDQINSISRAISELRNAISAGSFSPAIVLDSSGMVDVIPFELEQYESMSKKSFVSFNDAVDEYFTALSSTKQDDRRERSLMERRQQLERRLDAQRSQLEEIVSSARKLRIIGDGFFRHLNEIQEVLRIVIEGRRSKQPLEDIKKSLLSTNTDGSRIYPHFTGLGPRGDKVQFAFDGIQIEAETRKRPQDEAAEYYEKAKRLESKLSGLRASIEETELLLTKLADTAIEAARPIRPEPRVEKEWFEKFRWFNSSEGLLVIGGRDAASNETILKRYLNPEDLVMHAEVHGAPFFIVKTGGVEPKPETLKEAAQACVSYSRLWKEGIRSGDAYWVKPEQVTKSAPSGEYLAKGAFMIRGTRNYVRGVELALAVGLTLQDGKLLLMSGPPSTVRTRCVTYVEIRQGRTSPSEGARRVMAVLEKRSAEDIREQLRRIKSDDVIRLLPSGGVDVFNSISP